LKRIRAARVARDFPVIFSAVADGRLHLSAVVLLASKLTPENVDDLLSAAANKSKSEIEKLLAERFPQPDVPTQVRDLSPPPSLSLVVDQPSPETVGDELGRVETTEQVAPGPPRARGPRAKVTPLSAQ